MKRLTFLSVLFLILLTGTARAQFFLEQAKVVMNVAGGERINDSITINNTSDQEVSIRVYWEDFQYQPPFDGAKKFFPGGTVDGSASQWVSYVPQKFTLPPFGKQKIDYTVDVPQDISGGHYGVIFFEREDAADSGQHTVKIVTRIGCLFFIEGNDKSKEASLQEFAFVGNSLTAKFVNKGDVVLIPHMTYYVMDEEGLVADRGDIAQVYVPPGGAASWEVALLESLKLGRYTLVLNADLQDGDIAVREILFDKNVAGDLILQKVQE